MNDEILNFIQNNKASCRILFFPWVGKWNVCIELAQSGTTVKVEKEGESLTETVGLTYNRIRSTLAGNVESEFTGPLLEAPKPFDDTLDADIPF